MEHRQRSPCHAGTLPAGTVAPGSVPVPAADRHRNRGTDHHRPPPAPGCTRRSTTTPAQTKGQSSSAHRAACPGLFLLPIFQPCRLPDQHPGTRWVLSAAAPGKSWKVPGERWAQYLDIAPTTCTGMDQHRQRRTDDPAAHKLHSLHTLPDLTAASSPPPAPTDTAPRQPCRPPAAADHPANSQKPPTAARRRRGQILYLTGIWPLQYSQ